jgi:hypothetical protein
MRWQTHAFDGHDQQASRAVSVDLRVDCAVVDAALEQVGQGAVPVIVSLTEDVGQVLVARRAQHQFAHDRPELGVGFEQVSELAEVAAQLVDGRALGRQGRLKATDGVADHGADEGLLAGEVVVEGGDVDAGIGGDVAGPQALETGAGDAGVGRGDEVAAAIRSRFINHLIGV